MSARDEAVKTALDHGWSVTKTEHGVYFIRPDAYATVYFDRLDRVLAVYAGTERDENRVFKRKYTIGRELTGKTEWLMHWLVNSERYEKVG